MSYILENAAKDYAMTIEEVKRVIGEDHISGEEFYNRLEQFIKERAAHNA